MKKVIIIGSAILCLLGLFLFSPAAKQVDANGPSIDREAKPTAPVVELAKKPEPEIVIVPVAVSEKPEPFTPVVATDIPATTEGIPLDRSKLGLKL